MVRRDWLEFQFLASFGSMLIDPVMHELESVDQTLWDRYTERQSYQGSAHHATKTIYLRGPHEWTQECVQLSLSSVDYVFEQRLLPRTTRLMGNIFGLLGATDWGRVMVVALKPHGSIDEHVDEGLYAEHYQRVHLVLSAEPNRDYFYCGDDVRVFNNGELWWFNHRLIHSASNLSSTHPRIHLILDFKL